MQRLATILGGVFVILLTAYLLDTGWEALFALADPLRLGIVVGGFVAAIFVGELGRLLRLPRTVGYLAVGVFMGPFAAHYAARTSLTIPSAVELFSSFSAVFTGAVALAGLAIGLRFRGSSVLSNLGSLGSSAIGLGAVTVGVMTAGYLALDQQLGLRLFADWPSELWIPALLLGLLAATSGASSIWATHAEFHVEGGFTDTQLQVAIFKDGLLGAGVLAIIGAQVYDQTSGAGYSEWLALVGIEFGIALGAGLIAGGVLLATLRWVPQQIVPMSVILAVLTGLGASQFPGFAFVGAIVAGIVTATGSRYSHAISESLDRGSPVTVSIIFLHLGLLLELPLRSDLWIAAGALALVRLVLFFVGSTLTSRLSQANESVSRHLSRAMVSQGIGTLLLTLYVIEQLPAATGVVSIVAPLILADAVLGPIIQRAHLVRMGIDRPARLDVEAPRKRRGRVRKSVLDDARAGGLDVETSLLPPAKFDIPELDSAALTQVAQRVRSRLERTMDRVAAGYFEGARRDSDDLLDLIRRTVRRHVRDTVEALRRQQDPDRRIELLRERRSDLDSTFLEIFRHYGQHSDHAGLGASLDTVFRDLQGVADLPSTIQAPELPHLWEPSPADSRWVGLRKTAHRISKKFGPAPMRAVPVRIIGNEILLHGIVARLEPAANMVGQHRLYLWHKIEIVWSELDQMYARCLDQVDRDREDDEAQPVARLSEAEEAEELLEFDRRLAEGKDARPASERLETDGSKSQLLQSAPETPADDAVSAYWRGKLQELSFEEEQLRADVHAHERDTRRRMALAFATSFDDFTHALQRAGTFLLPTRSLAPRGIDYHPDAKERAHLAARHWRSLVSSHLDRRSMRLQLRLLQFELHPIIDETVSAVSRELASRLTYYPAETSERCREVVVILGESIEANASIADLLDAVVQLRSSLADFLQDDALHSLHELRQTNRFGQLLSEFTARLEKLVAKQPEVFSLPSHDLLALGETESAAHVEHVTIPFRQVLDRHFVAAISASLNELDLLVRATVDRVASGLGEVNRVVTFNLDAAASELRSANSDQDEVIDLVTEFAVGGLRRAGHSATDLLASVEAEIESIERSLVDISVNHLKEARALLLDDNVMALASRAQSSMAQPLPRRGRAALEQARVLAARTVEAAAEPIAKFLESAEERLSFDEGGYADLQRLGATASFENDQLEALPNAYRRLFAPVPVEIPEIFVGRDLPRKQINAAIGRWRSGRRTSVVVTGGVGFGRTSFLHRVLAEELSDIHVVRWNVRERTVSERDFAEQLASLFGLRHVFDADRLSNALKEVDGERLVLIDGLERLYLRSIDGCATIRALADIIARAPENILWVTTCNSALFTHIVTRLGSDDLVTDQIELTKLGRPELEDMIMRRHRVSGYRLHFLDHEDAPSESDLKEKNQARVMKRYFDRLFALTRGQPMLSLFHWLSSIETTETEDTLVARPLHALRTGHLRHLDPERHMALGQFALHEELTEAEFAEVMRLDLESARRPLAYLESLGLLQRKSGRRDMFCLNEVLHNDIIRAIHERNII